MRLHRNALALKNRVDFFLQCGICKILMKTLVACVKITFILSVIDFYVPVLTCWLRGFEVAEELIRSQMMYAFGIYGFWFYAFIFFSFIYLVSKCFLYLKK